MLPQLERNGISSPVNGLAFSPDGRHLLSGGEDGALIWDVAARKVERELKGHRGAMSTVLAFALAHTQPERHLDGGQRRAHWIAP